MKRHFLILLFIGLSHHLNSQTKNINMAKLESLTPNIMVKDVNATLNYYIDCLGFKLIDTNPESGQFEWGYVMLDSVGMMFQEEKSLKTEYKEMEPLKIGGALTFYIRINDIDSYYDKLSKDINIIKPMNRTFYGTNEFAIMDLNGFILTFSETPE